MRDSLALLLLGVESVLQLGLAVAGDARVQLFRVQVGQVALEVGQDQVVFPLKTRLATQNTLMDSFRHVLFRKHLLDVLFLVLLQLSGRVHVVLHVIHDVGENEALVGLGSAEGGVVGDYGLFEHLAPGEGLAVE